MSDNGSNSDKVLFLGISRGDEQAFKSYFDRHKAELYRVALKLSKQQDAAEEIIQDVFISLWISRQHLAKVEDPAAYLYRILLNKTAGYLKKEANQQRIIKAAMQHYKPAANNVTEQVIDANESMRLIERALHQLPPQQKTVYRLSRQQGLSNEEIAATLDISIHTVRTHLSKATEFIKNFLKNRAVISYVIAGCMVLH